MIDLLQALLLLLLLKNANNDGGFSSWANSSVFFVVHLILVVDLMNSLLMFGILGVDQHKTK